MSYLEKIESTSPSHGVFTRTGGKCTMQHDILTEDTDLADALQDLIGWVAPNGKGGLARTLPRAHPKLPWLFVSSVGFVGMGKSTKEESDPADVLEADPLEAYAEYPRYRLTTQFEPRPYPVLPDSSVPARQGSWVDEDGVTQPFSYYPEWWRFTDFEEKPAVEIIKAEHGFMRFRTDGGAKPDKVSMTGNVSVRIPKSALVITWYDVPYSFVTSTNNYFQRFLGRINQSDWYGYEAGSLLFSAVGVNRFTPLVPDIELSDNGVSFSLEKVCDIQLIFEKTRRTPVDPPTPANANWVAKGHNTFPWYGDRRFYYVSAVHPTDDSDLDASKWIPPHLSFPMELLFQDPDV